MKQKTKSGQAILAIFLLLLSANSEGNVVMNVKSLQSTNAGAISFKLPVLVRDTLLLPARKDTSDKGQTGKDSLITTEITESPGRYNRANRRYFAMIDSMAKTIMEFPLQDSAGLRYAPEWVGTSNMGLRRPNYVIIHHTATNS